MFAVIYRFKLKSHQENAYKEYWDIITDYFIKHRGAIGSCLHKGENDLWVAYSRWPDKITRDASWSSDDASNNEFPEEVCEAISKMQMIKKENEDLDQYDEICLDIVNDKLY
ncbi:MAG: hypothetical protein K0U29_08900 [Gammaproteobacteria bacterium]|nr:hypothetical protein [Gammaproteobacteria bacterium]MCH9745031.1 hypothetical protein [Gammaproteobacteria bacterium]